jgi:hypothetical protein
MATSGFRTPIEGTPVVLNGRLPQLRGTLRTAFGLWGAYGLAAARYVALGAFMVIMLYLGFIQQVRPPATHHGTWGDVYRYQCFAVAFWFGEHGLRSLPPTQCQAVVDTLVYNQQTIPNSHYLPAVVQHWMLAHSPVVARFRTLPLEYPILSLIPFSLPLIAPPRDYALAFGVEMLLLALVVFAVLGRVAGWRAAAIFALFMAFGAYATGASRFDLLPAALTLGALVLAERRRWTWAYVLLALATMSKLYPVLLVIPLIVAQVRALPPGQRHWRRLTGLGWFAAICGALTAVSFTINPIGTYRQVSVLGQRPLEVESLPASLVWLTSWFGAPMQSFISFGSDNISSPVSSLVMLLITACLAGGLAVALVGLWRGRLTLSESWLAVLLLTVATGKIFSAQYLIWVFPFVAYTLELTGITPMIWMAICTLTTYSYPFLWRVSGTWHATIALRNALVILLTLMALRLWPRSQAGAAPAVAAVRRQSPLPSRAVPTPSPRGERPLAQPVADRDSRAVGSGTAR